MRERAFLTRGQRMEQSVFEGLLLCMIVHVCANIISPRRLPDAVIQQQIIILMFLSLLRLWHIIVSHSLSVSVCALLSLTYPMCAHVCVCVCPTPSFFLFDYLYSSLFSLSPVPLWASLSLSGSVWSLPVGVYMWAATCRSLYRKWALHFSRG